MYFVLPNLVDGVGSTWLDLVIMLEVVMDVTWKLVGFDVEVVRSIVGE